MRDARILHKTNILGRTVRLPTVSSVQVDISRMIHGCARIMKFFITSIRHGINTYVAVY